ncbi:MAG: transporter substrate-binding domain-containing protein, partial [Candidatus Babeliales bacterium]
MNIKIIILVTALIALTGYTVYIKKESGPGTNRSPFIVGTAGDYAPWMSINNQGQYEGFDYDVIRAVAQTMNKELILKDLGSMSSLLIALNQGMIDAIIWGMSITQDRLQTMAMVRYQGETVTDFPLLFWQKIPEGITSLDDMNGKTICVEPASSQDTVLSTYKTITKKYTEKVDDALLNIQYGKADAALVEPAIAKKFKKKYPEIQLLKVPLKPEYQVYGVGI